MLKHLNTSLRITLVSIVGLGLIYPFLMTVLAQLIVPYQANGSLVVRDGRPIGSAIVGERWTQARYFHGRPSAAGAGGYDPTQTGGTNLGPTSKKLIEQTRAAIAALRRQNPSATGPIPMDLVSTSASGIDPDISPAGAYFQVPRVAQARGLPIARVDALVRAAIQERTFGFLGEPRVNVLQLNLALDRLAAR